MAPTLHIYLLGDFRILYGDAPVTSVNSPRLQSLLAYLVMHRNAPQSRNHLAFSFWPDSTEAHAQLSFRQLVHWLRHALPNVDRFLSITARSLQWCADAPFDLDVVCFEDSLARAIEAEESGDRAGELAALRDAADRYTGDLLPSCYDEWILPERERLRGAFLDVLEKLVDNLESAGDLDAAISCAQRLLRHEPLREESYHRLMNLYVSLGNRTGAIRVYNRCEAVLQRELGAEPGPELRRAYELLALHISSSPSRAIPPGNLPSQITNFIGRDKELAAAFALFQRPDARLVTFTGPPGTGKTRLAQQVVFDLASGFEDGVFFVPLAPITEPSLVASTIAQTVGAREAAGYAPLETLRDHLREKKTLLLLDNFEQVLPAAPLLAELLAGCPGLKLLVTSRAPLRLRGEKEFAVPPLQLPNPSRLPSLEELAQYESVALFMERARDVRPDITLSHKNAQAVVGICLRLEGLPLAIELTAARMKGLSPQAVLSRLEHRLRLLVGGAHDLPPRQQALRSAIAWSYNLLSRSEQALFRQLGVFVGGCTLESAEAVCRVWDDDGSEIRVPGISQGDGPDGVLDGLLSLLDNSLLVVHDRLDDQESFRMLETIREYALEQLAERGEVEDVRRRHADYYLALAESAEPNLSGPQQGAWLERLEAEHDNLRAALGWLISSGEAEPALRLASALRWLWEVHGHMTEGLRWLGESLALSTQDPSLRAKALNAAGALAYHKTDYDRAQPFLEESLSIRTQLGDRQDIASTLNNLGVVAKARRDYTPAQEFFEKGIALAREFVDTRILAILLTNLGEVAMFQYEFTRAAELFEESLIAAKQLGNPRITSNALNSLGVTNMHIGDLPRAQELCEQSLALRRELGDKLFSGTSLLPLGDIAIRRHDYSGARASYLECMALFHDVGDEASAAWALVGLAGVAVAKQQPSRAARLIGAADARLNFQDIDPLVQANYDRHVASSRAQLDSAAWDEAYEQGRAMSMEKVIAYAVEESD